MRVGLVALDASAAISQISSRMELLSMAVPQVRVEILYREAVAAR